MALFPKSLFLFLSLFIVTFCSTQAYVINVGGSEGWTVNPSEDYDIWAARMRFTINDTLHFEYNKATDSVLEVDVDDYDKCTSSNPIRKLENGVSSFMFGRSGAFYFITGNKTDCEKGQKMHLIVMAARHRGTQSVASPPASIAAPLTHTPSPATSPVAGSPVDDVSAPVPAPAHSSARTVFNTPSVVSFVMISLGLVGFLGLT